MNQFKRVIGHHFTNASKLIFEKRVLVILDNCLAPPLTCQSGFRHWLVDYSHTITAMAFSQMNKRMKILAVAK